MATVAVGATTAWARAVVVALAVVVAAAAVAAASTPPAPIMPPVFAAPFTERVFKDSKATDDPVVDGFFTYSYRKGVVASATYRDNRAVNPVCQLVQLPDGISANASCTQYAYGDGSRTITYKPVATPSFCCQLEPAGSFWGPILPTWAADGKFVGNVTDGTANCTLYKVKAATPNAVDTVSFEWGTGRLCNISNAGSHGLLTVMDLDLAKYSDKPLPLSAFDVPTACSHHIAKCVFKS